jgi:hypothetical protein
MNKVQMKRIREIIRLNNDDLRIQTKFEKIKNSLQKKSEIIRRIINLITIRIRIYAMRINEVKVEHIDTNNQFDVIKYLQNVNASLHEFNHQEDVMIVSSHTRQKALLSRAWSRDGRPYSLAFLDSFYLHHSIIIIDSS